MKKETHETWPKNFKEFNAYKDTVGQTSQKNPI